MDKIGVIPRAAAALFDMLDTPTGAGSGLGTQRVTSSLRSPREYGQQNVLGDRNWSLRATYVEIYNEQLRDLLVSETTPLGDRSSVAIREDVKGNIILTGLRQVEINSVEDLLNALNFGSSIRQTDATAINAKSSRSHAVFSLNLVQRKSRTSGGDKRLSVPLEAMTGQDISVTTDSKLHFVDLAGSERLKNTGAQGERAREGISINGGLASLGKVISQLSSRQSGSHVSYRDSKLTRLLQDSLGGNAITYMVACVTQAEFHLSETLNTVQYAQRARAIQSKPRIQAVEEGDKQAVIDRLKAEVAFLRDQIRSASGRNDSPRRSPGLIDRAERSNEREVELQNQLLDTQESYTALGQRHARLISQMARAQESEAERDHQIDALQGENATDRLNRSNSFAQAVEQVVLEYEKTIQSLEQSLTSTRTTLSNTETNLLERETKCAYVETINSQMQSRLQKLMDREANTENYLHDLEAKLDGHTSGEEKNATIIMELRKEIARVRENEASCEDYISTLEERLAEADQDAELMQREIDKLEQIVERQRSLGKLDTLLYELDHVDNKADNATEAVNGDASRDALANTEDLVNGQEEHGGDVTKSKQNPQIEAVERSASVSRSRGHSSQNSAQSRFVADKLETVTQELVDLRVEHEATVNEYDALNTKYDEAMLKLAELQDTIDEARHPSRIRDSVLSIAVPTGTRPSSTISDARTNDLKDNPRSSASRSLSSELSSALGSSATAETSNAGADTEDDETATAKPASTEDLKHEQTEHLSAELERLRALAEEKDASEKELASKYAELEEKHSETLDIVEELKTEVYKARAVEASSPRTSTPVIRRKSSQNLLTVDRAHRSIASLRHIAAESFEGRPEVMQNFELNLNTAMHELLTRSERIQELEADVTAAKKEMETKMTIISGLTRERSSLKTSPMDISMVASLRDQLEQSERQMYDMRMGHVSREQELHAEIQKLQEAMHSPSSSTRAAVINAEEDEETRQLREEKVTALQSELAEWENKHKAALESMTTTEQEMRTTIQQLEAQLDSANKRLIESRTESDTEKDHAVTKVEQQHQSLVNFLRSEIDEYKAIINTNAAKFAELESAHLAAASELDNIKSSHGTAAEEASRHQDLVSRLETQILSHQKSTSEHQESLDLLKTTHAKELAELKAHEQSSYEQQVEVLMTEHAEAVQKLELDLSSARDDLMNVAVHVANALGLDISVENLTERIDGLIADHKTLAQEQKRADDLTAQIDDLTAVHESVLRDLESAKSTLHELSPEDSAVVTSSSFADQLSHIKNRFSDLDGRNKKNSRLIEELEEQLQNNFDEAQVTTNRLSTLQSERNAQLEEANVARAKLQADLETIREDFASLQVSLSCLLKAHETRDMNVSLLTL